MSNDKLFEKIFNNFGKIWIASAILGLVITGILIWGFISLVLHFT